MSSLVIRLLVVNSSCCDSTPAVLFRSIISWHFSECSLWRIRVLGSTRFYFLLANYFRCGNLSGSRWSCTRKYLIFCVQTVAMFTSRKTKGRQNTSSSLRRKPGLAEASRFTRYITLRLGSLPLRGKDDAANSPIVTYFNYDLDTVPRRPAGGLLRCGFLSATPTCYSG